MEIGLNPIDIDGEPMVLAGIIDVTARRKIELEKEQQRQELARSNADLEEFAYAASHDLKAPLRAIAHLVQWIGEDIAPTASPETLENLKLLRGRVTRLQTVAGWPAGLFPRRSHPDLGRGRGYRRGGAGRCRDARAAARLHHRLRGDDGGDPHPSHADPGGAGKP